MGKRGYIVAIVVLFAIAFLCGDVSCVRGKKEPPRDEKESSEQGKEPDTLFEIAENRVVKQAVRHKNLQIFPICIKKVEAANVGAEYITLDEAMSENLVVVMEQKGGGSVPTLIIENRSDKPLYLLGGEVITGGKQDRIVAQNIVIAPHTKKDLSVFCVERGRWHKTSVKFGTAGAVASREVRKAAQVIYDQGEVWERVDEVAAANTVRAPTASLKSALEDKEVKKNIDSYFKPLKKGLENIENIIGIVVVANGEVKCCDMFQSPKLFEKYKEKLLKSYILGLIGQKVVEEEIEVSKVKGFIDEIKKAKKEKVINKEDGNYVKRRESKGIVGIQNSYAGKRVHENYYEKQPKEQEKK